MRLPKKPLDQNMMWLDPPGTMRWLAGPAVGLGDPYGDCMSACIDKCNNAGFTEPGALQACIAACPTTCYLYKVPSGGKPNQPTPCMQKCLAAAWALTDPTAQTAAIAACSSTCKLQAAAQCNAGYTKDASGNCVPIGNIACTKDSQCAEGQECYQNQCVDKCLAGQKRDASGNCVTPPAPTAGGTNWGLIGLAAAAVAGIFIASRGQLKELGAGKGSAYRSNPGHGYVVWTWDENLRTWIESGRASSKVDADEKEAEWYRQGYKTRVTKRGRSPRRPAGR